MAGELAKIKLTLIISDQIYFLFYTQTSHNDGLVGGDIKHRKLVF